MSIAVLGIDLATHVFQLHGVDAHGRTVVSRRVSRAKLVDTVVQLAPRVVAMEACCGAHFLGGGSAARSPRSSTRPRPS
jgi:transposase